MKILCLFFNKSDGKWVIIKNTKLGLYRNSFVFRGSILWNKLPQMLRNETKLIKFKNCLRKWVLENIPRFDD